MAPKAKPEESSHDTAKSSPASVDISAAEAALKARLSRKRTKTGCLTCRKRRIKCGEERPVCNNCVKSKRHCEGYSQRVVFKQPPTFNYQPVANGGAHIVFQAGPVPATPLENVPPHALDQAMYGQLRPRPLEQQHITAEGVAGQQFSSFPQPQPLLPPNMVAFSHHAGMQSRSQVLQSPQDPGHLYEQYGQQGLQTRFVPAFAPVEGSFVSVAPPTAGPMAPSSDVLHNRPSVSFSDSDMPPVTLSFDSVAQAYMPNGLGFSQMNSLPHASHGSDGKLTEQSQRVKAVAAKLDLLAPTPMSYRAANTFPFAQTPSSSSPQRWRSSTYIPRPELARPIDYEPPPALTSSAHSVQPSYTHFKQRGYDQATPSSYEHGTRAPANATHDAMLSAAAVEVQDDDYYDVDEEMDFDVAAVQEYGYERQRALCEILTLNHPGAGGLQMRRYDTFIYAGILDRYRVEEVASPLKNAATARVFAHFISATGPSLSIFERHPRNTSVLFTEGSVPFSQQGLWTYTMPMAALRNQGLLHAMLALASLHIARLQEASVTPSMQHYAWALRRIHASVGKKKSRLKITTIAASLLLGFYEIMTADHMKWNMHLAGSKQLFVETDFATMTRQFRQLKTEKALRSQIGRPHRRSPSQPYVQDDLLEQIPDVDERVVSQMLGRDISYDDDDRTETTPSGIPAGLDLSKFGILKDLYWWYCKQDVYQSIVSGNPLLMDFGRWADCPPRAPLGKADAVYGSFDHLVLLLGRIADFAVRDRERKLKQVEANGGHWRPAPGMNLSRPAQASQAPPPHTSVSATSSNGTFMTPRPPAMPATSGPSPSSNMPQFYGMAPPPRSNIQMPTSYTPSYTANTPQSTHSPGHMELDIQTQTSVALAEYDSIRSALDIFSSSLGTAFESLTSEYQPPMDTAFGTALFYRSYDIGCLWALYNMAVIIAIRSHPHMPPAAHVAAGVAAQETAYYANEIGRIAAGIVPVPPDQPLNPSLGAALCESCMPSFFAAVQYQDSQQRHETVTRIFGIAKRTGWGSAELIANGCETAWVKAAEAGRGPPYQRIVRRQEYSEDPRLNGSWEQLDPQAEPDETNDSDRRLVKVKAHARLNWAIGVMGLEDDVEPSARRGS